MNFRNLLYTITLCFLFFSCTSKEQGDFSLKNFKNRTKLVGNVINLQNLNKPAGICVIPEKNLLLIIDIKDTNFVKAYDLKSSRFIKSFIKKGIKPNEQLSCHNLQYDLKRNLLYTSDFYKKKIFAYNLDEIASENLVPLPISDISVQTAMLNQPIILSNKIVDFHHADSAHKIKVLDFYALTGALVNSNGNYFQISQALKPAEYYSAYISILNCSNDKKKILIAYNTADYLEIRDTTGKLLKRVHGPDNFNVQVSTEEYSGGTVTHPVSNSKKGYTSKIEMNDNSVYVLYDGSTDPDYHVKNLFQFDSDLRPVNVNILDKPIFAFDIDWSQKNLYGLTHQIKNSIIKYQIQ